MEVVIAGGGVGGLAAALFLIDRGISVSVYEAVADIGELGVGINIQPHAVRELQCIGLMDLLLAEGNSCTNWAMYNKFGQAIWREPRGTEAGHEWPQISIHRGRLQAVLLDAVHKRLGSECVKTGHRLVGFANTEGGVQAEFDTQAGRISVAADVLIGADGIHSHVRHTLYPDEGAPIYAGMILWRGMTRAKPYLDGSTMIFAGYREQKFIAYPITAPDANGECLINWIAEIHAEKMLHREDWNRKGVLEDFLPNYADWRFDWLDIPELMKSAYAVYEYPMVDRDPLPQWTFGRVTLLGDAAHPMYPIGANGASQAIRDGAALATAFEGNADIDAALAAYESGRRRVTTEIVHSNRRLGPEQVMQIAHERAPEGFADIEDVIPKAELEAIAARYRQITWDAPASKAS